MLAFVLLLAGSPALLGTLVSGPGYQGVVVSCTSTLVPCWEPSSEQIAALEAVLSASAKKPSPRGLSGLLRPPLEYRRQYVGLVEPGGERLIWVIGYHQSQHVVTSGQWKEAFTTVMGGGGYFFSGRFAVARSRFVWLSVNAPE